MATRVIKLGIVFAALLAIVLMLRSLTNSMLFYPESGQWRTPAALGLAFEELKIPSDGDTIQAWWLPGNSTTGPGSGPVILMFHGNAGTIADRLENARLMIDQLDASVLLLEYPGYGDSTGSPSERSLFAAGRAGLEAVRERAEGRRVVLFGRSLGGAVAIDVASDVASEVASDPASVSPVDALIVESCFTTLAELGRALGFPVAAPLLPYRFDSLTAISRIGIPILVLHGDRDEIVPFEMGRRLYEAASSSRSKAFFSIEGAGHNDTVAVGGASYWRAWRDFLARVDGGL